MAEDEPTHVDVAKKLFDNLLSFDEKQREVIQSLRFRDQDHSIRCGALLGFSGLIIAGNLVQFSAGGDSLVHLSAASPWMPVARIALVLLLVSASLSLVSIALGRRSYSDEPWAALLEFHRLIQLRGRVETWAIVFCFAGTLASLGSLLATLFLNAAR